MIKNSKEVKGIIRNAFYTPNNHKESGNTCLDREQGENTEMFRYRQNGDGEMELIQMQKF